MSIELVVGDGDTGAGGHMLLSSGLSSSSMYGLGGDIVVTGGTSEMSTGGNLQLTSGRSTSTDSGKIELQTPDAGVSGVSGDIMVGTLFFLGLGFLGFLA